MTTNFCLEVEKKEIKANTEGIKIWSRGGEILPQNSYKPSKDLKKASL